MYFKTFFFFHWIGTTIEILFPILHWWSSTNLHHIGKSHTKNRFLGQNEFNGAVFYSCSVWKIQKILSGTNFLFFFFLRVRLLLHLFDSTTKFYEVLWCAFIFCIFAMNYLSSICLRNYVIEMLILKITN